MNEPRRWKVPLADIVVDEDLAGAALETFRSGWWSMGPRVLEFEGQFASFCGSAHAVAVANGTAALHLGLLAVGCGPGDEVVVPSLNFVAAANAIVHTGAEPVFCDVLGPEEPNLDPADVEAALTDRTKAIVALHYAGYPCEMDALRALAETRGLAIVEDAAHAPGASLAGRMCGTLADRRVLQLLLEQEPAGRRGRHDGDRRRRSRRASSAAPLARHDDAHVGSSPRPCVDLRRRAAGLQLPPRRDSRRDRARPARATARGERGASTARGRYRRPRRAPGPGGAVRRAAGRVARPTTWLSSCCRREDRAGSPERPSTSAESRRASITRRSTRSLRYRERSRRPLPQTDAVAAASSRCRSTDG